MICQPKSDYKDMLDVLDTASRLRITQSINYLGVLEISQYVANLADVRTNSSGPQNRYPILRRSIEPDHVQFSRTSTRDSQLGLNYGYRGKSKLEERIRNFFSCGKDWDGDGAMEIPHSAIYQALNFLDQWRSRFYWKEPLSAAPSPDGEIVLYWCNLSEYAEINFGGNGKLSMCWSSDNGEIQMVEEEFDCMTNIDGSRIWKELSNFLAPNDREHEIRM